MTTFDPNFDYQITLAAAIAQARDVCEDQTGGLSAQRRDMGGGEYQWRVSFDDDPAAFMTVMANDDWSQMSDEEIAAEIESCWDEHWDDVLDDRPVGDFSHASSDFHSRD